MAEYIKKIRTDVGDLQIDYESLANLPQSDTTLKQSGKFADAKAVGEAITRIEGIIQAEAEQRANAIDQVSESITQLSGDAVKRSSVANNLTTIEEGYVLDARQGYELNLLISKKASTSRYSAILSASGWSAEAPYSQTVNVDGILLTDDPIVDVDMSGVATGEDGVLLSDAWNFIGRVTANDGSITAYCYEEIPEIDVPLIFKVIR